MADHPGSEASRQRAAPGDARTAEPPPPAIARSAAAAGAATMTSRVLGLIREQVLAAIFGAGDVMDAYITAFRIPNLLRDLFAEGAMSAAFVPTFTRQLTVEGRDSAWRLANNVITALLVVTGIVAALGLVFAGPIVRAYAADFAAVPGKLELTVRLARIMTPVLVLIAVAAALMGMLNSLQRFFIPALSPAMFNVITIAAAIAVVPHAAALGLAPITVIAVSTLIGGVAQVALQWPTLRREGFRYRPRLDWCDPGLHRVLVLMGPGTVGMAATQVNVFVNTVLATSEGTGAVSWLGYAFRIMYLPIGLFGVSIATAVLPTVSRLAAQRDEAAVRATIADGLSLMMMLDVPATAGLVLLAEPIVRLLLEHGRFTAADTAATALAVQLYAIGLIGYSMARLASPAFYALGLNRTPVTVSVITVLLNAALNLVLARVAGLGYAGLALGTSCAAIFNAVVLVLLLRRRLGGLDGRRLLLALARIVAATAAMAAVVVVVHRALERWLPGAPLPLQAGRLFLTIAAGLVVLALTAHVLHVEELRAATALLLRKARPAGAPRGES